MTVFLTLRQNPVPGDPWMEAWRPAIAAAFPELPEPYRAFAEGLWDDPGRMAFLFCHNRSQAGRDYEGMTFSLGRRAGDRGKRDRLDLIVEDLRYDGAVDGLPDGVRLMVNPLAEWEVSATLYRLFRPARLHPPR